jgi:DNA uptake protein ComE-like DNA-binding protein
MHMTHPVSGLLRRLRQPVAAAALAAIATSVVAATPPGAAPAPAPAISASAGMPPLAPHTSALPRTKKPAEPVKWVDINSASRAELKTLPGIGDAEADRIIKNRPYLSKTELVSKKVLLTGPYIALKGRVVAMQKIRKPAKH